MLRIFWFLPKFKKVICPVKIFRLESTIDGKISHLKSYHNLLIYYLILGLIHSLYTIIKHFNEFLDPDNITFVTTIIVIVWIIRVLMVSFEMAAILDVIIN
jgi:hypothetical protein